MTWLLPSRGLSPMVLAFAALSCGSGGAPEAKAPDTESAESADGERTESSASSDTGEDEDSPASQAESPAGPCADGSCFPCGSGVCPTGFYCDEGAQGGAGCSWLPSCAPKATCACIESVLSDCSCSESDGAPHVKCG